MLLRKKDQIIKEKPPSFHELESYQKTASDFLELASEHRIGILYNLIQKKSKVSTMAKKLNITAQEVHRNFERLVDAGLLKKGLENYYHITTAGRVLFLQIPTLVFMSNNKDFFENHDFGQIPEKFIQRLGSLNKSKRIVGVTRVLEQWKSIYKNSNEYIFDSLSEFPADLDQSLIRSVKKGSKYLHIVSETAKEPKDRKKKLQKLGYYKYIEDGIIQRRMLRKVEVAIMLNEKEAGIIFPTDGGEPDLRSMFYSKTTTFHEWCVDYFKYCWDRADSFKPYKFGD